jgi:hypothetical protein
VACVADIRIRFKIATRAHNITVNMSQADAICAIVKKLPDFKKRKGSLQFSQNSAFKSYFETVSSDKFTSSFTKII